ncbi:class I SAM-dependent methyltransferase [Mariniphaga sp.]|uniref:class I SAM-dependent methyltransferase n=1 Tax=Mariniphaga sp. TaxID=1954475 RepID=UPI00356A7706
MSLFLSAIFFFVFLIGELNAQLLDVPYVPTPESVVEKMLEMAQVGPGDYVIDLGSGDGRIVIAAAKRGAYGHGIDLDPRRIKEARENAKKAGVEDKVIFIEGNIFDADFSRASVVTMYLLNSVNIQLRPHLLKNLKPASRLVSHDFDMGNWKPDQFFREETSDIYFWVIPAQIQGQWAWKIDGKSFSMTASQEFQEIDLQMKDGNSILPVTNNLLKGDRISFTAANHSSGEKYIYSGRVEGKQITGIVQIHGKNESVIKDWNATLQ